MIALNKIIVALVILSGVAFVNLYVCCPTSSNASEGEISANTEEAVLKVEGMTCSVCSLTIKTALKKMDGVVDAEVNYKTIEVKVWYKEVEVNAGQMVKAIENVGNYKVNLVGK